MKKFFYNIWIVTPLIFISVMIGIDIYNKDWNSLSERGMFYGIITVVIILYYFVKGRLAENKE